MNMTLIQSYVGGYFVSTIYRRSSSMFGGMYYETMVWDWDDKTKKRGNQVFIETNSRTDPSYRAAALVHHAEVCAKLAERSLELTEEDHD